MLLLHLNKTEQVMHEGNHLNVRKNMFFLRPKNVLNFFEFFFMFLDYFDMLMSKIFF